MTRGDWSRLVPIPEATFNQLVELQRHRGAATRLTRATGVRGHVISRTIRGIQKSINRDDLKKINTALKTFDPGPVTGTRKRRGRAIVRLGNSPEVHEHNGNGTPAPAVREAGLRALLDGMAIQAEITRRGIAEYLDGPNVGA